MRRRSEQETVGVECRAGEFDCLLASANVGHQLRGRDRRPAIQVARSLVGNVGSFTCASASMW